MMQQVATVHFHTLCEKIKKEIKARKKEKRKTTSDETRRVTV